MKKPFNKKKYIKNKIKQFYKDKKKNGDKKRVCKNCRLTYENKFTKLHMSNI